MTIYCLIDNPSGLPIWAVLSGASILQGGNPYFVPDFAERFEARPSLAIRIGKLGKGFASRFSSRYAESVAPCAVMVATDLLFRLQSEGLPWSRALCYDRSLAFGSFTNRVFEEITTSTIDIRLESAGMTSCMSYSCQEISIGVADAICAVARDNTLKTGDIIILPLPSAGIPVCQGASATLILDGETSVKFNIR